jgi:hypothetical protein
MSFSTAWYTSICRIWSQKSPAPWALQQLKDFACLAGASLLGGPLGQWAKQRGRIQSLAELRLWRLAGYRAQSVSLPRCRPRHAATDTAPLAVSLLARLPGWPPATAPLGSRRWRSQPVPDCSSRPEGAPQWPRGARLIGRAAVEGHPRRGQDCQRAFPTQRGAHLAVGHKR